MVDIKPNNWLNHIQQNFQLNSSCNWSFPMFNNPIVNFPIFDFNPTFSVPFLNFNNPLSSIFSWNPFNTLQNSSFVNSSLNFYNNIQAPNLFTTNSSIFDVPTHKDNIFYSNTSSLYDKSNIVKISNQYPLATELKNIGYNAEKGKKIANEVLSHTKGFQGDCGKYVGNALNRANVFDITSGRDGYRYPELLKGNPNFKEISSNNLDLSKLPAGCILSYGKGVSGYSSSAGHVEITLGDGRAASDGITRNIKSGARVFVPV